MKNKLKLSTKMTFSFMSIIILLIVISLISVITFNKSLNGFTEYRGLARDTNLTGELTKAMLMVRMNVKDFLIRGNKKDIEEYNNYKDTMLTLLEKARKEIQKPERAVIINNVDEKVSQYFLMFQKVIEYKAARNNIVMNILDVNGTIIENKMTDIMISAEKDGDAMAAFYMGIGMKHFLLARLYMTKFLNTNLQSHADRVYEELDKYSAQADILDRELQNPTRRSLLLEIIEAAKIYREGFISVEDIIFARNEIIDNSLDKLGPDIAENFEKVNLSVRKDQDILGPKVQSGNENAIFLVSIAAILGIIIGVVLAALVTMNVLKQLGADPAVISEVADSIARKDLTFQFKSGRNGIGGVYASIKKYERFSYRHDGRDEYRYGFPCGCIHRASFHI